MLRERGADRGRRDAREGARAALRPFHGVDVDVGDVFREGSELLEQVLLLHTAEFGRLCFRFHLWLARGREGEEDDHEDDDDYSQAAGGKAVVDLAEAAVDFARHALLLWRDAAHHRAARRGVTAAAAVGGGEHFLADLVASFAHATRVTRRRG